MAKHSAHNYNSELIKLLEARFVIVNRVFVVMAGGLAGGALLSYLLFWDGKGGNKEWIYKSAKEMFSELGLRRAAQDAAIRFWRSTGVLEMKTQGCPPTRHFKINKEVLLDLIYLKTGKKVSISALHCAVLGNQICRKQQNTTENTTKKNHGGRPAASLPAPVHCKARDAIAKKMGALIDKHHLPTIMNNQGYGL